MDQFDWTPILWIGGVFTAIITSLIGWIAYLIREAKNEAANDRHALTGRTDKHEEWIIDNNKKMYELFAQQTKRIAQNETSIDFLKELVLRK